MPYKIVKQNLMLVVKISNVWKLLDKNKACQTEP